MIFFYCLIGFYAFIFSWNLLTRKYVNQYKLYMVFGKKGSGKSTYLVSQALKYMKKGYVCYTNMDDFVYPNVRHINAEEIGDFVPEQNSVLVLDEVGILWNNRNWKTFKQSTREFFKLQRHYHVVCFLASQTFDVDLTLRNLTDHMYLQTNFLRVFSLGRTIDKHMTLTEPNGEEESRLTEALKWGPVWSWHLTFIPKYARYFDSFTTPPTPHLHFRADPPEEPKTPKPQKLHLPKVLQKK